MEARSGFFHGHRATIERLFERSGAARWGIAAPDFAAVLQRALEHRFGPATENMEPSEAQGFLESLYVEDLGLAIACRMGHAEAWREFDARYRKVIERIARAVVRDHERASEVAGSLYGDLFGAARSDGSRNSPLDHYHGRSTLAAWLRVVVVRREADWWRECYRADAVAAAAAADPTETGDHNHAAPADPDRARFIAMLSGALDGALAELEARDRLRLAYYSVHGLTLAQAGALLGEHESSVSRNLARTRLAIRRKVERTLKLVHRLSDEQISRCFEFGTEDWPFDLGRSLSQAK
ncbi:MAG TPA: sigma-70 family RNA polymerase sigma factor [Candidatus Binataceae bacterium]|nr:sigma-70 family RNA polymerase sigma factor [Candidatus Binataceae bacterium]